MNKIESRPIGQLILNKETPLRSSKVEHYIIPAYQRGYRWTQMHIKALLEDIDNFLQQQSVAGAVKESYCLQPVVVVAQNDSENKRIWEIVDGQQRLTTLYIILKRLGKPKFDLSFEKRPGSSDFLQNLSNENRLDNTPDFHFMSEAYKYVDEWFNKKRSEDIAYADEFAITLLKQVQVIWYEVGLKGKDLKSQEAEKIDIFNRLNIGKIPLEDAELVRALLMSKIEGDTERIKLMRQAEFSNEWHEMELWLQKPEVWKFLTYKKYANHIQLIFELLAHNRNSENYSTYKWFEQELLNSENPLRKSMDLWRDIKQIFGKFRYWHSNRTLYHYIGFLLTTNQSTLEKLLKESSTDKKSFKMILRNYIADFIDKNNLERLSYEDSPNETKNILLLFNVLSVELLKANPLNRFPFNLYNEIKKGERWSLEHIHAQQSQNPLQKESIIREWIDDTLVSIKRIKTIDKGKAEDGDENIMDISSLKEELVKMAESQEIDKNKFNDLKNRIIDAFESESTKHQLDNMALLSCRDNSKLNNAIFPVKRDRIIEMEREGRFIPPCTRNVFLKLYSKGDHQPYFWSGSDKEDYIDEIKRVFSTFKTNPQNDN